MTAQSRLHKGGERDAQAIVEKPYVLDSMDYKKGGMRVGMITVRRTEGPGGRENGKCD